MFDDKRFGRVPAKSRQAPGFTLQSFCRRQAKRIFAAIPLALRLYSIILRIKYLNDEVVLMERSLQ
jgi:peptidoglycan/LPS O-acetylase OafA/YrhL